MTYIRHVHHNTFAALAKAYCERHALSQENILVNLAIGSSYRWSDQHLQQVLDGRLRPSKAEAAALAAAMGTSLAQLGADQWPAAFALADAVPTKEAISADQRVLSRSEKSLLHVSSWLVWYKKKNDIDTHTLHELLLQKCTNDIVAAVQKEGFMEKWLSFSPLRKTKEENPLVLTEALATLFSVCLGVEVSTLIATLPPCLVAEPERSPVVPAPPVPPPAVKPSRGKPRALSADVPLQALVAEARKKFFTKFPDSDTFHAMESYLLKSTTELSIVPAKEEAYTCLIRAMGQYCHGILITGRAPRVAVVRLVEELQGEWRYATRRHWTQQILQNARYKSAPSDAMIHDLMLLLGSKPVWPAV